MKIKYFALTLSLTFFSNFASATVDKNLPYPAGKPSADDLAAQVFFVNHFYAVKNLFIQRKGKKHVTVLANKSPDGSYSVNTLRRFLNNDYEDGVTQSKDIALFHSGALRGTGILITDFVDPDKSQSNTVWLPAMGKIMKYNEPDHSDTWGKSVFTYGDLYLREPRHETHEILATETFDDCLATMSLTDKELRDRYLRQLYEPSCDHKGKEIYKLKSTQKYENWWYDYRISYVDAKSFVDYRTEYFKDGKMIKVIDKDWVSMDLDDPRGNYWLYWYGKNLETGQESMLNVPEKYVTWNYEESDADLWTEDALIQMRK